MDIRNFWKEHTVAFIIRQVIYAVLAIIILATITLFLINIYTHHGESEVVPDLRGLYLNEAEQMLANHDLYPEIIDSVYDKNRKLGTIIEQNPSPNSTMKKNRPVYIIINSKQIRQIPLPDVTDLSFRQADALIKANGLFVGNIEYFPSEYKNLVIDVKVRGVSVVPGTKIPEGSAVTLIVGSGIGNGETLVSSLKGLTLDAARATLMSDSLVIGAIEYDVQPVGDVSEYVIYRQRPGGGRKAVLGSRVDIWLSKDKSLLDKTFDEDNQHDDENDEKFF